MNHPWPSRDSRPQGKPRSSCQLRHGTYNQFRRSSIFRRAAWSVRHGGTPPTGPQSGAPIPHIPLRLAPREAGNLYFQRITRSSSSEVGPRVLSAQAGIPLIRQTPTPLKIRWRDDFSGPHSCPNGYPEVEALWARV